MNELPGPCWHVSGYFCLHMHRMQKKHPFKNFQEEHVTGAPLATNSSFPKCSAGYGPGRPSLNMSHCFCSDTLLQLVVSCVVWSYPYLVIGNREDLSYKIERNNLTYWVVSSEQFGVASNFFIWKINLSL